MKLVNITDKEIKQIQRDMRQFDDDWIAGAGTSFQDDVWRAQRKVFWELTQKLLKAQEVEICEDAISREAVINHICENKDCYKENCKGRIYKRCPDIEWLYDSPTTQSDTYRKKGE